MKKHMWTTDNGKVYPEDIRNKLVELDLQDGDVIMGHFDLRSFGKLGSIRDKNEFYNTVIDSILKVIGEKGGLIVPAFTHSFCKGEIFDIKNTKPITGYMSQVAFDRYKNNSEDVYRSNDPIFSCIGFGNVTKELFTRLGHSCFGDNSIFDRLYILDSKFLCFGFPFAVTYMHFVERRYNDMMRPIRYRYNKTFEGNIIDENYNAYNLEYDYFVRDLEHTHYVFSTLAEELSKRGLLKKVKLGAGNISTAYAWDIYNTIFNMMNKDLFCFLKDESKEYYVKAHR